MTFQLIATCAFGLEAVVKRELQDLQIDSKVLQPGWIGFEGDFETIALTNLSLRTADRVLIEIASFEARDFDQLFETTKYLDWGKLIPVYGQFPVKGRSVNSQLSSVPACQRCVKRAVAESLQTSHGTASLPESGALYQIEVSLRNDIARLTIDTTGPSLHKRGYRKLVGEAPLKETLAAAMIQLSVWNPTRPLIDPFCGSGTIPIEAAMIARKMAPGLQREFSAESWPTFPGPVWKTLREKLQAIADDHADSEIESIMGTDVDAEALSLARFHARRAGVEDHIHFQQRAFEDLRSKKDYGCVIGNPPYGERLKETDLIRFYKTIPQVLQRLPTWSHFILTSLPRFEAVIQKSATRRRKLYNGRIECMYYQYLGPRPPRIELAESTENRVQQTDDSEPHENPVIKTNPAVVPEEKPIFGIDQAKVDEQREIFANRLSKRARHLRRWPKRGISCYRLYERDIPEIPWVVDLYENALHIVEFERPHDRDLGAHAAWQDQLCQTAARTLGIEKPDVHFKSKDRQRRSTQHEKQGDAKREKIVTEGGLKFIVNLTDYVDTGLFLDHRITRDRFRSQAKDKRVINLFGYTGAFTVYAADGGAKSTLHVDLSKTYSDWAQRNMSINRFHGPHHVFETADVLPFLQGLRKSPLFDLAIVDPPTFSNSKRTEVIWDVQKNHVELLMELKERMSVGGTIYFSTNFRRFHLDEESLSSALEIREITNQTIPEDFRNKRIHRCWQMTIQPS